MTIIYQYKVATTTFFGFFKLLRRWRGSVYKLMYKETIIFCSLYTVISLVYRLALNQGQRRTFERIAAYCNSYTNLIPVSFVLGFYVSIIVTRWWQQFQNVPWPDRTLYILGSYLVGLDERGRIYRRTVARYMLFALILILRSVSVSVMKRYPTMEHIVDAGFITKEEVLMYEQVECKYNKFWVPLVWANSVISQARKEGRIESEMGFRLVLEYIADYRDKCSLCFVYDWITIPLVYTQVVTLAVYMFFGACLIGRQYVDNDDDNPDLYIPFFTLLQFFFYMGWLKVAEQMINPFGEDDDDYDMNWLIDRHTAVAMCLADQCHANYPPLVKDAHFNEIAPELPYTEAAMSSRRPNFMGSTYNLERPSMMEQKIIQNSPLASSQRGLRRRSNTAPRHGTGSTWSLFGFKPNLQRGGLSSSRETITSTMMNGHAGLGPLNYHDPFYREHRDSTDSRVSENVSLNEPANLGNNDLPPEYVPLRRARATTDAAHRPLQRVANYERERKWSFPLSLLRKKHEREATGRGYSISSTQEQAESGEDLVPLMTPPTPRSRFRVDLVPEDQEVDASKQTRNKQLLDKHMGFLSVSRPPVLSAIEEGNTIRSVKDLIPSPSTHSLSSIGDSSYNEGERPIPSTILEETGDEVFYENENDNLISNAVNKLLRSSSLSDTERYQTSDDPGNMQTDIFSDQNLTTESDAVQERHSLRETEGTDYAGSQEFQKRRKPLHYVDDDDNDDDDDDDNVDDAGDFNYADDAGTVGNLKTFNLPTVNVSEDGEENSLGSVCEEEDMLDSNTNIDNNDLKVSNKSVNNKNVHETGDRDSPTLSNTDENTSYVLIK